VTVAVGGEAVGGEAACKEAVGGVSTLEGRVVAIVRKKLLTNRRDGGGKGRKKSMAQAILTEVDM